MTVWILDARSEWVPIEIQGKMKVGRENVKRLIVSREIDLADAELIAWKDLQGVQRCVLLAAEAKPVRINGSKLFGLKVLKDKDEISFSDPSEGIQVSRMFFSSECLPRIVPFEPLNEAKVNNTAYFCMRCKDPVHIGQLSIHCPSCHRLYHQMDDRACWTYDKCLGCQRPGTLDYSWRPDRISNQNNGSLGNRLRHVHS
jgi:hypothetical protein